ncbi:hypothetical protein [Methylobacterium brachiatum]|jgi:hypothetical protein|uniref:hypothetical protein n=1 Tax=Methylobacterium brachiatum TaxID=269660 RepID=UPI000EFBAFD6|nr:hypothetical protein [Methylobacterium brachiatum]AYO83069.1 hypothetical protein EBB05_12880 [Methylobacterium brachiatum]
MNRCDVSNITPAKMQAHIETAARNRRVFEAAIDPEAERRGTIRATDIVWGSGLKGDPARASATACASSTGP